MHKLAQRLMATFLVELDDHVRALNRDLLALEKEPAALTRDELFQSLFRSAHSLKGAARSVSVTAIEDACHRLEEIFTAARNEVLPLAAPLFSRLFRFVDAIQDAGTRLREQGFLPECDLTRLLSDSDMTEQESGALIQPESTEFQAANPPGDHESNRITVPPMEVATPPGSSPPKWSGAANPSPFTSDSARTHASVRIPATKLDTLLAQSGELLVARRRVEYRIRGLTVVRDFVEQWRREWDHVEKIIPQIGLPARNHGNGADTRVCDEGSARLPYEKRRVQAASPVLPSMRLLMDNRQNLRRLERELDQLAEAVLADERLLDGMAAAMDNEVRRIRMLPFTEACEGLHRMVHDLAQANGKLVDFVIEGSGVELDRSILQGLKDPLMHLVRNAIDHGIEAPDERRAAGKPERGRISVTAALRGAHVEVIVADDGFGLNSEALREQARKQGITVPAEERDLSRLIFTPGFSTARIITNVSGRGVGLDVVKSSVESMHGTVDVGSQPKRGTRFVLTLPLTLTTLRALLFIVSGQTLAVASSNVEKLVRFGPEDLQSIEGRDVLSLGETPLPVVSLAETLGFKDRTSEPAHASLAATVACEVEERRTVPHEGRFVRHNRQESTANDALGRMLRSSAIVIRAGDDRVAFVVDELVAEQEIVVKNLGSRIRRVRHVTGATLLPSGRVALVLNAANLIRGAMTRVPPRSLTTSVTTASTDLRKRLLIVEDSLTTRTLMRSILEASGYDVLVASDGEAAWQTLQAQRVDLVVSDVEMPRLDGYSLTQAIRSSKRLHEIPVILVTARESDQDKARGIEVGADAYLLKSAFDQGKLMETIGQLV